MGILNRVLSHWRENYTLSPVEDEARLITREQQQLSDLQLEAMTIARTQAVIRDREHAAEAMRRGEAYELGHEPVRLHDYYVAAKDVIARENERALSENGTEPFNMGNMLRFHGSEGNTLELRDIEFNKHDFSAGEWDEVERGLSFNHAELINVTFIPATTIEALHLDRSSTVKIENAIFEEMGDGDILTLPRGNYNDITFNKVTGGTLQLSDGSVVNGLHSEGARMNIEMGRSVISGLTSDATTNILSFKAEPGAEICNSHIREASFALDSDLRSTVWRDVTLENVNMRGIDFSGAQFNLVTVNGQPLTPPEGFQRLVEMGVAQDQLPYINGQSFEQYQQLTQGQGQSHAPRIEDYEVGDPRRTVLELAAQLNVAVNGKNGVEARTIDEQHVIQTEQAKLAIQERNEEWAAHAASIRLKEATSA
jgi:uncharacterized protein YjbI with pentapeptide repeats